MSSNLDALLYIVAIFAFFLILRLLAKRIIKSEIELKEDGFFYKNSFIEASGHYSEIKKISLSKNFFGVNLRIEGAVKVHQKFFGASARQIIQIPDLSEEVARQIFSDINCKILEIERFQSKVVRPEQCASR